jgi:cytochrome c biogenesis protein CcmG/thiol:disulfide interchange protein DsbE
MTVTVGDPNQSHHDDRGEGRVRRGHPIRWVALTVGFVLVMTMAVTVGQAITDEPNQVDSPLLGKPAPAFELSRIDTDGTVASSRFVGRVTILNFWATWCVPCRKENRALDDFYRRWEGRGVELIGILYSDDPGAARDFRAELGGTWPLVDDPDGRTAVAYGITGVPETFIIDGNGIIVATLIGAVAPTTLDDILVELAQGDTTVTYRNDADYRPNS